MRAHLRIEQFELQLEGCSGRVVSAEASGDAGVRQAMRMVGNAIAGQDIRKIVGRTDPETSLAAAARVARFASGHEEKIGAVIVAAGERGATAKEIARATGLTDVQVNRRLGAMGERELIERRLRPDASDPTHFQRRGGCAIWWAK